ncbi:50S ribosomal protein L22 [Candidatus Daviesbacteria bacterium]|nr:50S ribosomal protein L22 [Candidatus Daviesbacteria bacterium]
MEVTTIQKYIHTSPRKLKLVADLVRALKPDQALQTLEFTNKAAARPLAKAIKTVLASARQQNLKEADLTFKKLEINEGPILKRMRAGSRGHADPYTKRTSHIKIVLSDEGGNNGTKN